MTPEGLEAWQRAYLAHRRVLAAEHRRWAAECAKLRARHGLPAPATIAGQAVWAFRQAWHQAALDELDPPDTDDQAEYARDGAWFAADAPAHLPPCEMTG